jgi:hypothetical protein
LNASVDVDGVHAARVAHAGSMAAAMSADHRPPGVIRVSHDLSLDSTIATARVMWQAWPRVPRRATLSSDGLTSLPISSPLTS